MPLHPRYVIRRADGAEAGELFDIPSHGFVGLHIEDLDLARSLIERGVLRPPRPPFLDAADHGIHGAYVPRPQVNWFLAPPIDDVAAELDAAIRAAGPGYAIAPAPPLAEVGTEPAGMAGSRSAP